MIGSTNSIWETNKGNYEQLVNYTMLYDAGDECVDITGGWEKSSAGSSYLSSTVITKNVDNIALRSTATTGSVNYASVARTVNPVDLKPYSYMLYDCLANVQQYTYYGIRYNTVPPNVSRPYWADQYIGSTTDASWWGCNYFVSGSTPWGVRHLKGRSLSDAYLDSTTRPCFHVFNGTNYMYHCAVFKADDYETLAEIADISASSIGDILANSAKLLSKELAVEFMIKQCTGDFMAQAIQSETFLTELNNSVYKTKIQANEHWSKFLNMVA